MHRSRALSSLWATPLLGSPNLRFRCQEMGRTCTKAMGSWNWHKTLQVMLYKLALKRCSGWEMSQRAGQVLIWEGTGFWGWELMAFFEEDILENWWQKHLFGDSLGNIPRAPREGMHSVLQRSSKCASLQWWDNCAPGLASPSASTAGLLSSEANLMGTLKSCSASFTAGHLGPTLRGGRASCAPMTSSFEFPSLFALLEPNQDWGLISSASGKPRQYLPQFYLQSK